jgi:excisionase family DNA binding protein
MTRHQQEQASFEWTTVRRAEASADGGVTPAVRARPRTTRGRLAGPATVEVRSASQDAWLTADEAKAHLGLPSRKALYAAVARGQVPAHRLGRRRLRFNRGELDSLLGRLHESTGVR